jgi:hypothetical protein
MANGTVMSVGGVDYKLKDAYVEQSFSCLQNLISQDLNFINGSFNSYGTITSSSTMLVSGVIALPIGTRFKLFCVSGYRYSVTQWDEIGQTYAETSGNLSGETEFVISHKYQIITFSKTSGTINPVDSRHLYIISAVKDELNQVGVYIEPDDIKIAFIQGAHNGTGEIIESQYNIVSGVLQFEVGTTIRIVCYQGYVASVTQWETIGQQYTATTGVSNSITVTTEQPYVIILIRKANQSSITPSESSNAVILNTADNRDDFAYLLAAGYNLILGDGHYILASGLTVPKGRQITGTGMNSIILSEAAAAFGLTTGCRINNLVIDGISRGVPSSIVGNNGILINQTDSSNCVENVMFVGITGKAIQVYNVNGSDHLQNTINQCDFEYCGCGVYIGERAETCDLSGSSFERCHIGVLCIGGNNRTTNCLFSNCTIAIDCETDEAVENDSHSIFDSCIVIHNTYGFKAKKMNNGLIFSTCSFHYGPITIDQSKAILFIGCEFGYNMELTATNSYGTRLSNCIIHASHTITGAVLKDCFDLSGNDVTQ